MKIGATSLNYNEKETKNSCSTEGDQLSKVRVKLPLFGRAPKEDVHS